MPLFFALLAACVFLSPPLLRAEASSSRGVLEPPRSHAVPSDGGLPADRPLDLKDFPWAVNPVDRALLLEYGYVLKENLIVLGESPKISEVPKGPLYPKELWDVLERLRADKRRAVLEKIHDIQRKTLGQGRENLTEGEAHELTGLLSDNWDAIPGDVRSAVNDWLENNGKKRVRGPDLAKARAALRAWGSKGGGLETPDPLNLGGRLVGVEPPRLSEDYNEWFMREPPPREVKRRVARVKNLRWKDPETGKLREYPRWVVKSMEDVVRYASDRDGEDFLRVLEEKKTPIYLDNAKMMPYAWGSAHGADPFDSKERKKEGAYVVMPEFMVRMRGTDGKDAGVPHPDPSYYKKLGLPVPALHALDPNAKPARIDHDGEGRTEIFADGSSKIYSDPSNLSGLLLHEVLHLDTGLRKNAGLNSFTNEYRSFTSHFRFWVNRDLAQGRIERAKDSQADWVQNPLEFREGLLQSYTSDEVGLIKKDEVTVGAQLRRVEAELNMSPAELEKAKYKLVEEGYSGERKQMRASVDDLLKKGLIDEEDARKSREQIDRLIDEKRDNESAEVAALNFKDYLKWKRSVLLNDQVLEITTLQDDYEWHRKHGIAYVKKGAQESSRR